MFGNGCLFANIAGNGKELAVGRKIGGEWVVAGGYSGTRVRRAKNNRKRAVMFENKC